MDNEQLLSQAQQLMAQAEAKMKAAEEKMAQAEAKLQEADEIYREALGLLRDRYHKFIGKQLDKEEPPSLSHYDGLTKLPTPYSLRQYLEFTIKYITRHKRSAALLAIHLEGIKTINEAIGFRAGDELLIKVAQRLQKTFRQSDIIARSREDRFLVLLSDLSVEGDEHLKKDELHDLLITRAESAAARVHNILDQPFTLQGQQIHIAANIGISLSPGDAETATDMMEHAEVAASYAREGGRGSTRFYDDEIRLELRHRLNLENDLQIALRQNQFYLLYQPVVELESRNIHGVEALLRWNHPTMGDISPKEFLEIAEESGLIVPIGEWVLERTCKQLKQWQEQGLDLFMNLNLSSRELLHPDIAQRILSTLSHCGLDGYDLVVDVNESAYLNQDPRIHKTLERLGKGGVQIAIDDYGSGVSSLKTIRLSKTRILKLDSTFVAGIPDNRHYLSICVAAIRLASSLNMRSLAEGIETKKQYNYLYSNECYFGQGYYFSKPVTADEIPQLVKYGTPGKEIIGTG